MIIVSIILRWSDLWSMSYEDFLFYFKYVGMYNKYNKCRNIKCDEI